MTTIAISSTHIAWDSQVTYAGDIVLRARDPKVRIFKHRLIAMSGDVVDMRRVNTWVEKGCPKKEQPSGSWDLFIIDASGPRHMQQNEDGPMLVPLPFALGSGMRYALAILMVTDDALLAVKTAGRLDTMTCGPYHAIAYQPLIEKFKIARTEARQKAKAKTRA